MVIMDTSGTIDLASFVIARQLAKETGLQYKQILKDIHNNVLPAVKIGNSYYIYRQDAKKYTFDIVCRARGQKPGDYDFLLGLDGYQLVQAFVKEGAKINDKSKD